MVLVVVCSGVVNVRDKDVFVLLLVVVDEFLFDQSVFEMVIELVGWVVVSKDNQGYLFVIMDKVVVQVLVFGGDGKLCGVVLVLFGLVIGDYFVFGVVKFVLSVIFGYDCIMFVGCFIGVYGFFDDVGCVLWVDYDFVVLMYLLLLGSLKEKCVE